MSARNALKSLSRIHLTALVVVVASLAYAAPASAYDWAESSFSPHRVNKSFGVAVNAWDGELDHCIDSGVGIYSYSGSSEFLDVGSAYAFTPDLGACSIFFNNEDAENYGYPWFCSVMVHEMGHVAFHDHVAAARDIMTAVNEVYWRKCLNRKQARRFKRRRRLIDRSIVAGRGESGRVRASSSANRRRNDVGTGDLRGLHGDGLRVHRITTLPVR